MSTAPAAGPMLQLERVSHHYGPVQAVADVSLAVAREELVCLLGPSGCGKSTLLRIAAGLEQGGAGTVRIAGESVASAARWVPPEKRRVGLVFQEPALFPHLSVVDNVAFGLAIRGASARRERVDEWLAQLGIEAHAEAYPHMLSGGQQQRVALARALAAAPRVMLLDEPFSSLDARLREQIRDDTLHVLKKSGTATLLVTHDPEEAMFMADRIALMRAGRIEQCGTPTELYCQPANSFVATFFSPTNRFTGPVHGGSIATPLGPVPAGTLAEGSAALVLTRFEAVRTEGVQPAATGRVLLARLLGRQTLLHLRVIAADGQAHHIHARSGSLRLPPPGSELPLGLDLSQTFVFASTAE